MLSVAAATAAFGYIAMRALHGHSNDPEMRESRVFAPPSSWLEATTLVAEACRCRFRHQPSSRILST